MDQAYKYYNMITSLWMIVSLPAVIFYSMKHTDHCEKLLSQCEFLQITKNKFKPLGLAGKIIISSEVHLTLNWPNKRKYKIDESQINLFPRDMRMKYNVVWGSFFASTAATLIGWIAESINTKFIPLLF